MTINEKLDKIYISFLQLKIYDIQLNALLTIRETWV